MAIEERYWRGEPIRDDERRRCAEPDGAGMRARKRFAQHFLEAGVGQQAGRGGRRDAGRCDSRDWSRAAARSRARLPRRPDGCWPLKSIAISPPISKPPRLPNVTVVTGDVLSVDLRADRRPTGSARRPAPANQFRVVGNLPYNISSPILFALLDLAAKTDGVRDAMLMLQKEVADRLVAKVGTGDYGVLTVLTGGPRRRQPGAVPAAGRVPAAAEGPFGRRSTDLSAAEGGDCRPRRCSCGWSGRMFTQRRKTLSQRPQAVWRRTRASTPVGRWRRPASTRSGGPRRSSWPKWPRWPRRASSDARKLKLCYSFRRNPPVLQALPAA